MTAKNNIAREKDFLNNHGLLPYACCLARTAWMRWYRHLPKKRLL